MRDVPVMADSCYRNGGCGATTAEQRQVSEVEISSEVLVKGVLRGCCVALHTRLLVKIHAQSYIAN